MTAKIAAAVITLVVNIAAGVAVFFALLLALNGYSESDATPGIVAYVILALLVTLSMTAMAVLLVGLLLKKGLGAALSAVIAVAACSIAGVVLKLICSIIGVAAAEFVRVNY